ncbi:retrovirus-related pol polyprotein from transposon TNT 1-94 [Tanacetum coccineum]
MWTYGITYNVPILYKYNINNVFQSASKAEDVFEVLLVLKLVLQLGSSLSLLVQEPLILYCMICKREDLKTSDHEMYTASLKRRHNRVIHIRGGVLAESSQSSESSTGLKCNTYRSTVHSTTNHNEFDHFKRGEKIQATKAREPTKKISQNFSSPYSPEQNGVAERKNRTLIEAARTMMNGSVLSKHFWTEAVRITCYTQTRSIIVKRHDKTPYEIFKERIPDISYFHMFGCPMFTHNQKDHLSKFDAKADDGYFLEYFVISKAFRVFNIRRQQVKETYHVTFDESMEAIRRSLTKLTQENIVFEVIAPNEPDIPLTKDNEGPPDLINTEGTHEQNFLIIIGDPGEGMLTRSMAAKLTTASASECLFVDFLSEIEPKKVLEALRHPGWVDAMQEELN